LRPSLLVLGGGLSGIAAAIRCARYFPDVLILEQHVRSGGLNSYYYRRGRLFETGLHAITNFAPPDDKKAPLNLLLRQLGMTRGALALRAQAGSEIRFSGGKTLAFTNNFTYLTENVAQVFPQSLAAFKQLAQWLRDFNPFAATPGVHFRSARAFLRQRLPDPLLTDMLLCPLSFYGSSVENDMDLSQFAIMFRAIFFEGLCRPAGTIKDVLDALLKRYQELAGAIRYRAKVTAIIHEGGQARAVRLEDGEEIDCRFLLSTIGHSETLALLGKETAEERPRLGFVENIVSLPKSSLPGDKSIVFFNTSAKFRYAVPDESVDFTSGVLCLPANFLDCHGEETATACLRTTHLANYEKWRQIATDRDRYQAEKQAVFVKSLAIARDVLGISCANAVYEDSFTPLTVAYFTGKRHGAIYGAPDKIKDGDLGFTNLFLAGTDQGFLGIIGSMLSGVSMVNRHILPKL
jgi:phytoene dehydrogenase-like protein